MTEQELQALPDVSPSFGYCEQIVDGKMVRIPTINTVPSALFQHEDDGLVMDANGTWWMTGWVNGVRVRQKFKA